MFLRFCKQSSNGDLKKRFSLTNASKSEKRRTAGGGGGAEVTPSIEHGITEAKSNDDGNASKLQEDEQAVQTVDLVADCPSAVVQASVSPPSSSRPIAAACNYDAITASPRSREPSPSAISMGQRSSRMSLQRPKISLTWVLRNQQHEGFIHDPGALNNNNSISNNQQQQQQQQSTVVGVVEIHREKDTNPVKEQKEEERVLRRSTKSAKSVKITDGSRSKEEDKENAIESIESFNDKQVSLPLRRIDKNDNYDNYDEIIVENDIQETSFTIITIENEQGQQVNKERQTTQSAKEVKDSDKVKRTSSESNSIDREVNSSAQSGRENKQHKHRKNKRGHRSKTSSKIIFDIADLDSLLVKASIDKPANIPVVLTLPSVLYQTQSGTQAEHGLPLGTVVNAIFKKQAWLYVQTPHGEEGYVDSSACMPLGILPQSKPGRCWEDPTDVFPRPLGNLTDVEKLRGSRSECGSDLIVGNAGTVREYQRRSTPTSSARTGSRCSSSAACASSNSSNCNSNNNVNNNNNSSSNKERSIDRLYDLRASSSASARSPTYSGDRHDGIRRHTLLVVSENYEGPEQEGRLKVTKDEVVVLLGAEIEAGLEWFWVKNEKGRKGLIPATVAEHGFL